MHHKPNIYIYSGAGLSAISGIPTFRGENGIWGEFEIEKVCNIQTWKENREKVFDFYRNMNNDYSNAYPNDAHIFISNLQKKFGENRVKIITQNVDTLLERDGCSDVLHVHGKIGNLHCTKCRHIWEDSILSDKKCQFCKTNINVKPYVIMFGENSSNYKILQGYLTNLREKDIFIVVGTSGNVINLRGLMSKTKRCNTPFWRTNYFLNVLDTNHVNKIPTNPENYIIKSCDKFFQEIEPLLINKLNS